MSRKRNHGRGRGRPPRRHHQRAAARPDERPDDLELFRSLRGALRSGEPIELLQVASGLLEVTDPRDTVAFAPGRVRPGLADMVESFIGVTIAETTAALTAIRALTTDDVMAARITGELETRRHPMPAWLKVLDQTRAEPAVWCLTHVLGDGDDYLLGVTLPSGEALSALVYVDHNLGSVVKEGFVVAVALEDLVIKMGTLIDDPDQSMTRADPATARPAIEAAIDSGARLHPSSTSDTWPMCRPLMEWMVRVLPAGGVAPKRREWTLEHAAREVGGVDALEALDDLPLPEEDFDWDGIDEDIRPAVAAILEQSDGCAGALLDVEHQTAMRRFLARAARNDGSVFARKASPVRGAAAIAWVICTGNRTAGVWSHELTAKDLLAHFGITGSVSDRAGTLMRAAGVPTRHATSFIELGDPGLLVSARWRSLIGSRDRALAEE